MKKSDRADAVTRSHHIVELLAGRYFDGAANAELADALKVSRANISRDLARLEAIGYARKLENGHWALTSKPLAVMQMFTNHYQNMQNRMAAQKSCRYARAAARNSAAGRGGGCRHRGRLRAARRRVRSRPQQHKGVLDATQADFDAGGTAQVRPGP